MNRRAWIEFIGLAFAIDVLPWAFTVIDTDTEAGGSTSAQGSAGQGLWLMVPVLVAAVSWLFLRQANGPLGMGLPRQKRWWGIAVGIAMAFAIIAPTIGLLFGAAQIQLSGIGSTMLALVGFQIIKNVAEEFLFRGRLTQVALRLGLPGIGTHLVVGAVWAAWHIPLWVVWTDATQLHQLTSLSLPVFLPMFLIATVILGPVFGLLRERSGSLWPGVLLHTVSGTVIGALLAGGYLTFDGHADLWFSPNTFSVVTTAVFVGTAALLAVRGRENSQ